MLSVGDITRTKTVEELNSSAFAFHSLEVNLRFKRIDEIADRYCTVVDVNDEEKVISVMLDDGFEAQLPLHAFVGVIAEESLHSKYEIEGNLDFSLNIYDDERHGSGVVKNFAAQCIQTAFRRYLDCKSAIRIRKINSSQRLVQDMAAATIINGWRRSMERKRRLKILQKSRHKSWSNDNLSRGYPCVLISDVKTLNLPIVLLGNNEELSIKFMIMNKFSKTPTGVDPPPSWQSEMSGKVISGKEVKWPHSSLIAPVILEELEINPNYQLILRVNLYYNNMDLMGYCECNLLAIYDDLATKDTANSDSNSVKKAVSRLLTMNSFISTNFSGDKPVVSFLICLESPPPPSYRCKNNRNVLEVGVESRKVLRNSFISSNEVLYLQSSSTVDYPTKDNPSIDASNVSRSVSVNKADASKQSNNVNIAAPTAVAEKPTTRVKNSTKFEKLKHKRSKPAEEDRKLKSNEIEKALHNSNNSVVKRSLFDEIFALVMRKYAAVITVGVKDFCIILDALDVPVREDILQSNPSFRIDASSTSNFHNDDPIQLPLSDAATLAATLSLETIQRNILVDSSGVASTRRSKGDKTIITEKLAEIARNELLKLIRGNFDKCKEIILKFCAITEGGSPGRPSEWSTRQVMQFVSTLGIESRAFSTLSGNDFLKVRFEDSALRDFDIHQPILQKRFAIYRQTILYIDKWWDHGLRPNNLFSSAELKRIAMNNFDRKVKRDAFTESGRRTFDTSTTEVGSAIKIAEFDELLREIVRFNRAYGWGLSPGLMTNICAQVAGRNADIISFESHGEDSSNGRNSTINSGRSNSEISSELKYMNDSGSHPPQQYYAYTGQQQPLTAVKGCKWARITFSPSELNPSLESSFIWRCEKNFLERNLSSKGDFLECFALLPAICCRKPSGKEKHLLEVIDDINSNKNSNNDSKANSLLIAAKVQVGMIASIVDYSTLIHLYQRFDWWDQPSYDFLRAVAGSNVQVVSVAGLNGSIRGRIGVQCLDSDLCDAVPVEAILSLVPQNEFVAPAVEAEKKSSKKRLPSSTYGKKGKLSHSKGFKGGSANASGHTAKTSASESIDIDMKKCKLVEASMLSNLSSVVDQPQMVQPSPPVIQIVDRRSSHGTEGGDRPLSRPSSTIFVQHLASVRSETNVVDTSYPEESPSNDLIIPDSPRNYAWLKLVAKGHIPNKDAEVTAAGNLEPKFVSRKRREFSYPTLNLAFEPTSPVQVPSKIRKERLQENNRSMNGAKYRAANYQSEDKAIDNEDGMEMEFVTFVKSSPSGKKMNSNNNDSNGTNSVRPKSAPSIPKQRTMVNTPCLQGLNTMGSRIATDFNAVSATEVDLVSNIAVNTPPRRQQQSIKGTNKFQENNKTESARFVEPKNQSFDDSEVFRVGEVSGSGGGGDFSRPSSAGTLRQRRPKTHSSLLDPSGHTSPDPTIVKESLNGANFKLRRQSTETENNAAAGAGDNSVKNRSRRANPRNNSKANQWSQQGGQDREDALRKREMSLSEREASFKESYLRRQLKRLGVGTGDT